MRPRNTAVLALMLLNTPGGIALAEPTEAPPKTAAARDAADLKSLSAQEIQEVQQALRDSGQYKGPVDGIAGNGTAVALERFQRDHGLSTDGLSKETRFELGLKPAPAARAESAMQHERTSAGTATKRPAPDSATRAESKDADIASLDTDQIRELQQRLQKLGYYNGEVDGKFAASTRQALSRFYRAQADLAQRGRISPQGAQALGLDASDIQPVSGTDEKGSEPQREPARDINAQ
jgi:peptidoglycan hydrolase-like protein with peptidoglycan-binding domain